MLSKRNSRNYEDDNSGSCLKKQKHDDTGRRRRVPGRGPGVAELEKIRLEEKHISTTAPLPPPEKSPAAVILPTTTKRTGPVYPFSSCIPTGSFPDDLIPPAPVFHRNHDLSSLHYLPPMNLPNPQCYQFIEPPSNQTSCQQNILLAKRSWQVIAETRKCNTGPTLTIPRDGKQIKSLDRKLKNHFQDSGTTIRNPITFDSPSPATLPTQPIMPTFSLDFPHSMQKEGFYHDIMPQRNSAAISSNRKPFYSFLSSNDEQSTRDQDLSFSLKTEGTDHGIDLRLKL
ncbi:unnamed protein product [Eruca vesicaria subsp. sativa]|uniref:Uncharacterized protein n=1 Tax=Eruca vesicaria subsp. sativa TaxID=29727 RepID=A0ABC8ISZ2_ERUVS|nr:unnamed protein product [Eruca vesicaria subsp. sativa]